MEVENRRLGDEFKFVIPKLDSLFERKISSCEGTTSQICSIIYGSDQRLLNTTVIIFLQYFKFILIYLEFIRKNCDFLYILYFVSIVRGTQ